MTVRTHADHLEKQRRRKDLLFDKAIDGCLERLSRKLSRRSVRTIKRLARAICKYSWDGFLGNRGGTES